MWSPHDLGMGGGMNQLMLQAGGGGSRLCVVEGESLVEVWRGGKVQVDCGARPFEEKGAPLWNKGTPL